MLTIEKIEEITRKAVENLKIPLSPENLYDPIRYTLESGGKRVRPMLTYAACNLFGGRPEDAEKAAMAIEVYHNFTLLHDDIMDKALTRRKRETVHIKWDENTAILSGDAMLIYAYRIISSESSPALPDMIRVFTDVALGVCEGQQYDMDFEKRENVTREEYVEMIRLKTSVLIGGAAQLGAIVAGASEEDARAMYAFGENLGLAFQVQDDILDTYGDSKTFGKSIGGDIESNKKTLLLVTALETSRGETRERLLSLTGGCTLSREDKYREVRAIYDLLKVKEKAQEAAEGFFGKALSILDSIKAEEDYKKPLREIVRMLEKREK